MVVEEDSVKICPAAVAEQSHQKKKKNTNTERIQNHKMSPSLAASGAIYWKQLQVKWSTLIGTLLMLTLSLLVSRQRSVGRHHPRRGWSGRHGRQRAVGHRRQLAVDTELIYLLQHDSGTHHQFIAIISQADQLSGKRGNVREVDSCLGNVRDFTESQGNVREKIWSQKTGLKLFIVSCIFASILDFAEFVHFILVSDHALLHSYPHHWQ